MLYSKFFKRLFDFIFALIAFPFLILAILIVGPLIYLSDKGPVFYSSRRIGQNGTVFKMFKFRTMIKNAPDIRLKDGSTYNSDDDPRLIKGGSLLRKMSIDELPQIINVLTGDMSFIGPRPDPEDWLDKYSDDERIFLNVKPGISGYNQAYFRNNADSITKIKNDVYYAQHISVSLDIKILLKTIRTVLLHENLYVEQSRK